MSRVWRMASFLGSLVLVLILAGCQGPQRDLVEGNRAYAEGDAKGALVAYGRALESSETSATAHLNIGRVLLEGRDAQGALPHLDEGLRARPDFSLGYVHRARAEILLDRKDVARRDLEKALALDPNLREGWLELGKLLGERGEAEKALEALAKIRGYNAYQAEATFLGVPLHRQLGQSRAAIAELESLAQNQPFLARAFFELGALRLESRDYPEAERRLRRGLEIEPTNREGRLALAMSLEGQGDWPRAAAEYQAVLAGSGDDELGQKAREALARRRP